SAATTVTAIADLQAAIASFESAYPTAKWIPLGRENNKGTIEVSSDPARSLIERITNGIDAVLEAEWVRHSGKPECSSPREAAEAWLNVPKTGLSSLSTSQRQELADRLTILLHPGDGQWRDRLVVVTDHGTGILPDQMPNTILSLSETNKTRKRYVIGA